MTYYALLKPFKWPFPILMNTPEKLCDSILGSPLPILMGF